MSISRRRQWAVFSTFVAAILVLQLLPERPGRTAEAVKYIPGRVVVTFKPEYMPGQADVDAENCRFGIPALDAVTAARQGTVLRKFIPGYPNQYPSKAMAILGRTFIVDYADGTDPWDFVPELSVLPYFEIVDVDRRVELVLCGTPRYEPSDSMFSPEQWNLDNVIDSVDIDAPEAWAIERGDPSIIIGITDTGTMIDTFQLPWQLHPDFNYYFNPAEDNPQTGVLDTADVDRSDAAADVDTIPDNVIGASWADTSSFATDTLKIAFWGSQPINATLDPDSANPWKLNNYSTHGLNVASIVAAKAGDPQSPYVPSTVGVANGCKVYHVRIDDPEGGRGLLDPKKMALVLAHAALYADVINMSWGFRYGDDPGPVFEGDLKAIAEDDDKVLVAAVGNDAGAGRVFFPARYPFVLGVGNMRRSPDLSHDPWTTYDSVSTLTAVAVPTGTCPTNPQDGQPANSHDDADCDPCDGVYPDCGGDGDPCDQIPWVRQNFTCTSAASAVAAGIAALVRSRFPTLHEDEVRSRIERSAEWYWPNTRTDSLKLGHGKVNAYRALTEWGAITENTTWDVSDTRDGTYHISGDLIIDQGTVLTINKGVKVKVAAEDHEQTGDDATRVEIIVKGTLKTGTGTGSIVFESFSDTVATDADWVGIKFDSTSSNNVLDGFVISNAQVGIENHAPVTLTGCRIEDCEIGIEAHDDIDLSISAIRDVTDYGIKVVEGDADLYGITVLNSGLTGLFLEKSAGNVDLSHSWVKNSSIGVHADSIESVAGGYLSIWRSVIDSNNTAGIKCDYSHAVVESTQIHTNAKGVTALNNANPDLGHQSGGQSIGRNDIQGNTTYHIENLTSGLTIKAEKNWWGSSSGPPPTMFYGSVDVRPWLQGAPNVKPDIEELPGEAAPRPRPRSDDRFPVTYDLSYNYPNPFNPTTTIRYAVPRQGDRVQITIYDVRGAVIRVLVDEDKPPGVYTTSWDGRNDRGQTVASGVYFLRMTSRTFHKTRKIVLLK